MKLAWKKLTMMRLRLLFHLKFQMNLLSLLKIEKSLELTGFDSLCSLKIIRKKECLIMVFTLLQLCLLLNHELTLTPDLFHFSHSIQ